MESEKKLFFVNMGGSIDQRFGEVHEFGLFVSTTKENAECRGQSSLLEHVYDKHIDYVYNVQNRLKSADGKDVFIHLVPADEKDVRNNYYNTYIKL